MQIPRCSFGMTVVGDWAYIAGGAHKKGDRTNSCEKINLATGEIQSVGVLTDKRSRFHLVHVAPAVGRTAPDSVCVYCCA